MTKRDFEIIATTLRSNNACEDLCWGMALNLKMLNESFDVNKFMKASSKTFNLSN